MKHFLVSGCVLIILLGALGCKKPAGFVGTWKTSTAGQGSDSTMTFNADQTMSFVATNSAKQAPYKLTGMGTWKATDKDLTVTPASMDLDMQDAAIKAKTMPYIKAQLNVAQTGPVVWKSDDEFVCTKNGVVQNFVRVK